MSRGSLLASLLVAGLAVPLLALAANSDADFRNCMRDVTNNREDRIVDRTRNYHNDRQSAFEQHRGRLSDAWGIDNDRDRDATIRQIDTDQRNILRDLDKNYRNDTRNYQNDFRNDQKRCRDELRDREKNRRNVKVGKQCRNSDECNTPYGACTTEFGDCRHPCGFNQDCQNFCTGSCVLR